ncbi:hypothetical protein BC938DRAFT_471318 [Jimgerdemannia flammicorona]|uniref:Uncharacterized protein n=1 Tax=Jimgerdemannia flammicorona TaxID=994334 RepID=A0A433Q8C5_9FUNG|nr:hypothetical protein BC938DRAFT_471318 [Jimgerdemannia flammicorona]
MSMAACLVYPLDIPFNSVQYYDPTSSAFLAAAFSFSSCAGVEVYASLRLPSRDIMQCGTYPVDTDDFTTITVTCQDVVAGQLPTGEYDFEFDFDSYPEGAYDRFTITHVRETTTVLTTFTPVVTATEVTTVYSTETINVTRSLGVTTTKEHTVYDIRTISSTFTLPALTTYHSTKYFTSVKTFPVPVVTKVTHTTAAETTVKITKTITKHATETVTKVHVPKHGKCCWPAVRFLNQLEKRDAATTEVTRTITAPPSTQVTISTTTVHDTTVKSFTDYRTYTVTSLTTLLSTTVQTYTTRLIPSTEVVSMTEYATKPTPATSIYVTTITDAGPTKTKIFDKTVTETSTVVKDVYKNRKCCKD